MAEIVFVLGESGSGKSRSMKFFDADEALVLKGAIKKFPFKTKLSYINLRVRPDEPKSEKERPKKPFEMAYARAESTLIKYKDKYKVFIIDDFQYLMAFEFFESTTKGYDKFTDVGQHVKHLLDVITMDMPEDVIVYLLSHIELKDDDTYGAKTIGKMLDEKIKLEGLATVCIRCINDNGDHKFKVIGDGEDTVKSPEDMFEEAYIDNNLKLVDTAIREYYGMEGNE